MIPDVVLHQFSHQTIDGSPGRGQSLQHFRALFVIIQGPEYGFELADDFFGAIYQVYFFGGGMGHRARLPYGGIVHSGPVVCNISGDSNRTRENLP